MAKRKQEETVAASEPQQMTTEVTEESKPKYVVLRGGFRVSDSEYDTPTDPVCEQEINFWTNVSKSHSHGEKVEAVLYDSKKHRVW